MSADECEWTYDAEARAGYLRLRRGDVKFSETAGDRTVVDSGSRGETLGIEVLSSVDAALIDAFLARVRRDAWNEGAQAQADTYGGQIDTGPNPLRGDPVTVHSIDTEALRNLAGTVLDGGHYLSDEEEVAIAQGVRHLLDQLDQAEHRIARLEAQSDIRGRAVVIYRERAREAEARIKAVRDLCDDADKRHASVLIVTKVRRALDT